MPDVSGYFTYREWEKCTVDKIAAIASGRMALIDESHREGYLRVQIESMIRQALRHGRSGRGDDDPITP